MFYAAYIHADPDGSASGSFPDVPGCYFAGDTIEEAIQDAHSALEAHFETLAEAGEAIPESTGVMTKTMSAPDESDTEYRGGLWAVVNIDLTKYMGKVERINITLPHHLVSKIDNYVNSNPKYSNRSKFLAEAALKAMREIN